MAVKTVSGMVIGAEGVQWTTLRESKGGHAGAPVSGAWPRGAEAPPLAGAWKHPERRPEGLLSLAAPGDRALMRVLDLPTEDRSEVPSMVELQIDKISPFPVDNLLYSYEVLLERPGLTRVLVAGMPREDVDKLVAPLREAGRLPARVDLSLMGWWRLLRDRLEVAGDGRCLALVIEPGETACLAAEGGSPILLRSLPPLGADESSARELADEVAFTLTTLDREWGPSANTRVLVFHLGDAPSAWITLLQQATGRSVDARPLDAAVPLSEGMALRAWEQAEAGGLNLAAPEWKERATARRMQRRLLAAVGAVAGLWLLAVGGFLAADRMDQQRVARLKERLQKLKAPTQHVREVKERVESLRQYGDRTHSAIECLREVCVVLPPGVELSSFTYKKGENVSMRGSAEAANASKVYDFLEGLQRSPIFQGITEQPVNESRRGAERRIEFKATLKLPGPGEKES